MANEHADGPTTFNLTEADLQGDGKFIDIGSKLHIKKIQVKKNTEGKLELHLSDHS
jgi:hypothetical protein